MQNGVLLAGANYETARSIGSGCRTRCVVMAYLVAAIHAAIFV
jgi:hypothetical protein